MQARPNQRQQKHNSISCCRCCCCCSHCHYPAAHPLTPAPPPPYTPFKLRCRGQQQQHCQLLRGICQINAFPNGLPTGKSSPLSPPYLPRTERTQSIINNNNRRRSDVRPDSELPPSSSNFVGISVASAIYHTRAQPNEPGAGTVSAESVARVLTFWI